MYLIIPPLLAKMRQKIYNQLLLRLSKIKGDEYVEKILICIGSILFLLNMIAMVNGEEDAYTVAPVEEAITAEPVVESGTVIDTVETLSPVDSGITDVAQPQLESLFPPGDDGTKSGGPFAMGPMIFEVPMEGPVTGTITIGGGSTTGTIYLTDLPSPTLGGAPIEFGNELHIVVVKR